MFVFFVCRAGIKTTIEYVLEVTGFSPSLGSLYGGTTITITGFGFSPVAADNNVTLGKTKLQQKKMHQHSLKHSPCLLCNTLISTFFTALYRNQAFLDNLLQSRLWLCVSHTGDRQCRVTDASDQHLECVTQSGDKTHTVTNQGIHPGNISLLLYLVPSRTQHLNTSEKGEQWLSAQWLSHHVNDFSNTQAARKIAGYSIALFKLKVFLGRGGLKFVTFYKS